MEIWKGGRFSIHITLNNLKQVKWSGVSIYADHLIKRFLLHRNLYRTGIAIALIIRSLDPSLSIRLILLGHLICSLA